MNIIGESDPEYMSIFFKFFDMFCKHVYRIDMLFLTGLLYSSTPNPQDVLEHMLYMEEQQG